MSHACKSTCCRISGAQVTVVSLMIFSKRTLQIFLNMKMFGETHLRLHRSLRLILKTVSDIDYVIILESLITGTFDFAYRSHYMNCQNGSFFFRLDSWKTDWFSHHLINCKFHFSIYCYQYCRYYYYYITILVFVIGAFYDIFIHHVSFILFSLCYFHDYHYHHYH